LKINSLIDIYDRKNNSFDDIRFMLATLVLFVHSYALLYGEGGEKDFFITLVNYQLGLGSIAVYGFFILSGFFMIQSLESKSSLAQYTKNRLLRIIPAFWMSLGISAFILVPIISNQGNIFSFEDGSALDFFTKAGSFHIFGYAWTITGAFPTNPTVDGINGSIWTLKHEIALYFILPLIVWLSHGRRVLLLVIFVVFFILALANILTDFMIFNIPCCRGWVFASNEYNSFIIFASYFFAGVVIYQYREYFEVSKRLFAFAFVLFILSMFFGNLKIITLIALPLLIITFGATFKRKVFSKTGDYSYGMYIYAFPVQQTLVHFYREDMNVYLFFVASFVITLILSIISWHLMEKIILRWKNKGSGIEFKKLDR